MTNLAVSFEHNRPEVVIWDPVRGRNVTMEEYNNPGVDMGVVTVAETVWPEVVETVVESDQTDET
jgi:hypothetical protein